MRLKSYMRHRDDGIYNPIIVIIAPLASLFDIRQETALKTEHLVAFQDPAYDAIEAKSI